MVMWWLISGNLDRVTQRYAWQYWQHVDVEANAACTLYAAVICCVYSAV